MAKFLTFNTIGAISDSSTYLGLSADSQDGTAINTLDQNIVYRIRLNNQKRMQSWTSEQKLTHKVIYDFDSKKYVGVFNNRHLKCWGEEDQEIGRTKTKIPRPLQEIISFENRPTRHTILVYTDGTCESLSNRLANNEANWPQIVAQQSHEITNIACFETVDKHVMLTYFVKHRKTGQVEFVYFLLNEDNLTPNRSTGDIAIKISRTQSTLCGYTVVKGEKFPSLMTIWSDKRIFMLPLCCNEDTPTDIGSMVVMFDSLRVDKPLTLLCVGTNCVAIYGGNTKQDGASLILYNTRYQIVDSMQHFKVRLDNCRLWVIGEFILMAVNQKLTCAPFRIYQEKLIDIIGAKRSIEWNGYVNKDCINEESELEENMCINTQALQNGVVERYNDDNNRQDAELMPEIFENFESNLESLYKHDIALEIVQDDSLRDAIKVTGSVHPKDQLSPYEEIAILMEILVSSGGSEAEITELVIPLLITAKLSDGLAKFLRKSTNISERMLAASLQYFVSMDEPEAKSKYINQVFACSFDPALIKEHLRTNLKLKDAIYLLERIYNHLNDAEFLLEESPQYGHHFDSDKALINWFIVILEAHYQQFLLVRDLEVNEMIVKWKKLIESFIEGIRALKPVTARISSIVNGIETVNPANARYFVQQYQIYR